MRKHNFHPKIIEKYLEKYYKNINSRDTVRVYLKTFFDRMSIQPEALTKLSQDEVQNLLFTYIKKIEDKPKKTQAVMLNVLKKFLVRNEIAVKELIWEELQIRNNLKRVTRAITKKETPTAQDLKKILSYTTGIKAKTLFVFCASTGLRINEALSLTWDDIDLNDMKVTLIEKGKSEIPRYTFFTTEAKELLTLWKVEREKMLLRKHKTSKFFRDQLTKMGYNLKKKYNHWFVCKDGVELTRKEVIDLNQKIFPFDYVTAQRMWTRLLEKAGKPYNTKDTNPKLQYPRYLYNVHSLRRFWFTQLMSDRANEEFVNYMGGHSSLLDNAYKFESKVMENKLKAEYLEHMKCLLIFETQSDLTDINKSLAEKDKQMSEMQKTIEEMKMQITELRLEKLERINGIKKS